MAKMIIKQYTSGYIPSQYIATSRLIEFADYVVFIPDEMVAFWQDTITQLITAQNKRVEFVTQKRGILLAAFGKEQL